MANVQSSQTPGGRPAHAAAPSGRDGRDWFDQMRSRVDRAMSAHLDSLRVDSPASKLLEAVRYSCQQGGKRVRPILVLESCRICDGDEVAAMPAALAIECIHTFSLIHDDLPAMDDDDLRRGRPTNHRVFGEANAVLAGDWLEAHAFALLAANPAPGQDVGAMVAALAHGTQAMIAGQVADIAGESQPTDKALVVFIHRHKTAALIEAACRLGALAAGVADERLDALGLFGHHLGLAFQIADDVLDRTSTTAVLGKRAGKDEAESKQTYPAAFGLDQARQQARDEVAAGIAALERWGPQADRLRELAFFVIDRDR